MPKHFLWLEKRVRGQGLAVAWLLGLLRRNRHPRNGGRSVKCIPADTPLIH